ncbi:MAG TPA: 4'-phosphopantetheinyl transferase superfamily protein [Solirubrobacterales bacterium]|nr:4'-phosphopantetheinyl transferase superfamily protein [Solirubrobacterales bacterium]
MSGLADLLPPQAVCVEARQDEDGSVWAAERGAVAMAVEARRREFATGRSCARRALAALGAPVTAIPRGPRGEPIWPRRVIGSITHCAGYRAAALAWEDRLAAIGIDAEPNLPLPARVLERIAGRAELGRDRELRAAAGVNWDRLLFSAKECVYKAWFPFSSEALTFSDADVVLGTDGRFCARLTAARSGARRGGPLLEGRWALADGVLVTALTL